MADADSHRVSGIVRRRRFVQIQRQLYHPLDLFFIRGARAANHQFNAFWGIKSNRLFGLLAGQNNYAARLNGVGHCNGAFEKKVLFHRHLIGRVGG